MLKQPANSSSTRRGAKIEDARFAISIQPVFSQQGPVGFTHHRTLGWKPRQYAGAILAFNLLLNIFIAFSLNAFVTRSSQPGLIQDPTSILVDFLLMPSVGAFYIWSISVVPMLLRQLYRQNFLTDSEGGNEIVEDLSRRLYASWALVASVVIATVVTMLFIGTYRGWYPWPQLVSFFGHSISMTWLKAPMWFLTIYGFSFWTIQCRINHSWSSKHFS